MERMDEELIKKNHLINEHYARYNQFSHLLRGHVVDCACGIGYASEIVTKNRNVDRYSGFDLSQEAISSANKLYKRDNVSFKQGSLDALELKDNSVDCFISMETLEHVNELNLSKCMAEIVRVLKPAGIFIGSVPTNQFDDYCEEVYGENKYHITKFSKEYLKRLLEKHFKNIHLGVISCQVVSHFSPIGTLEHGHDINYRGSYNELHGSFLFVCSNEELKLRASSSTVFAQSLVEYDSENLIPALESMRYAEELALQRKAIMDEYENKIKEINSALTFAENLALEREKIIQEMESHYSNLIKDKEAEIDSFRNKQTINTLTLAEHVTHVFSDFFDTIVYRDCHPEEVKRRWCRNIIEYYTLPYTTDELYELRIDIEAEICSSNLECHGEQEFKYSDFSERIIEALSLDIPCSQEIKQHFLDIELTIEKEVQHLNDDVISFLKKQKERGRKIVVISDFYHSQFFFDSLLTHHGIEELLDNIYISCDNMKSKRSGKLYPFVLESESVVPNKAFMIGDNYHSDFVKSNECGIAAFHIVRDFSSYESSLQLDKRKSAIVKQYSKAVDLSTSPFSWMAIPLYIFTKELYQKLKRKNANNVIFLAREGEFLKEMFDAYLEEVGDQQLKSHYMYASRRGTYLPSIYEVNIESFNKLLYQYPQMSISGLLDSLALSDYKSELKTNNKDINFEQVHTNLKTAKEFKKIVQRIDFINILIKESNKRRSYLSNYISDLVGDDDIYLVDVGWRGSIQDNIQKAINKKVTGYYCGLLPNAKISESNVKKGLLFEFLNGKCTGNRIFNEFRASFEVFCGASHGSLIKYTSAPEYGVLENNEFEINLYNEKIRPIQIGIFSTFRELVKVEKKTSMPLADVKLHLIKKYSRKVLLPSTYEMDEFSEYKHYENFGCFGYSEFNRKEASRVSYLKSLIKNPTYTIGKEWWKPLGFRKNRVSALIPIYYLYRVITMRFNK